MKILITGANGLVGSHFVENYSNTLLCPTKEEMDISSKESVQNFFKSQRPDAVIHSAAFTDVSKAEEQRNNKEAPCWIVNVKGTANLINSANSQTFFIHISTDVVFSGHKDNPGPYSEDNAPEENPDLLSWYGRTKKEAEKLVASNSQNWAILRIANPVRAKYPIKLDYIHKILKLYDTGKLYPMFDDQYLTLTYINEVTKALKILLAKRPQGIFHVSSTNVFTPYKLADLIIEKARGKKDFVKSTSIKAFLKDNPSRYPEFGGLKVEKTQKILNLKFSSWEEIVEDIIKQLPASE